VTAWCRLSPPSLTRARRSKRANQRTSSGLGSRDDALSLLRRVRAQRQTISSERADWRACPGFAVPGGTTQISRWDTRAPGCGADGSHGVGKRSRGSSYQPHRSHGDLANRCLLPLGWIYPDTHTFRVRSHRHVNHNGLLVQFELQGLGLRVARAVINEYLSVPALRRRHEEASSIWHTHRDVGIRVYRGDR